MNTLPIRQSVVNLCVKLSHLGYLAGTGGNIALRIDADRFAVTPSAIDYLSMHADDVCVVRLTDLQCIEGDRTPSVETSLHARVFRLRPDVSCSIHTHQPVASACALLGRTLEVDDEATRQIIGPYVPLIGYMPSGTALLAGMVGRAIAPDLNAYLMRNHGVLCCGASLEAAVASINALEGLARRHLAKRIAEQISTHPRRAVALHRVLQTLESS
ncbi:class II aldolase/adducin family protein [Rhodoferax sp.]|uniref:class II aldolase/adducin family protein n=1 Tax=Rhodoferax sp. TaxID=50421 RepID=UPI00284B71EE|nr:class II aldolase/adducin family protein [Rhodoferax sp.]MDR3367554.1 class II aldolase/adducin family protein [Rhodoferax sp.]